MLALSFPQNNVTDPIAVCTTSFLSACLLFCYIRLELPFSTCSPFTTLIPPTHIFIFPVLISLQKVHRTSLWTIFHYLYLPKSRTEKPQQKITKAIVRAGSSAASGRSRQITVRENWGLRSRVPEDFFGTAEAAEYPGSKLPAELLHGHALVDVQNAFHRSGKTYTVAKRAEFYRNFFEEPNFFK